jgi:hypothetical protein
MLRHHIFRPLLLLGSAVALLSCALWASGMLQAHASSPEPLLPNLVADPPDNVSLSTDSSTGTTLLLLRFNGYVHNIGPGALDFRGSREAPKVSQKVEEEVERAEVNRESLPQKTEEELASPPMKVSQRLFTTNEGNPEESVKYLERPHREESSGGEMIYVDADGHHHWHLQKVAKYSLWNASKSAEVAPAQKVGFCLDDSQHVETSVGPKNAVYSDSVPPYRDFCQQYRPNATSVYEGISPGWRDVYDSELAFQWVDVSNVLPGEYWLREDVNPLGVIDEVSGANAPSYATSPTIIPGFDALAQTSTTESGHPLTVTLESQAWEDSATPQYTIVGQPQHGTLSAVTAKGQVIYTPQVGYSGSDSFTYAAVDPHSQFPLSPAVATVSIEVGESQLAPSVAIAGAPASMIAGTSVQLSANVSNDDPNVTWSASAGSIAASGLYTAPASPPPGGDVAIVARTAKGAEDQRTIEILPVPVAPPAPQAPTVPGTSPSISVSPSKPSVPGVSRPQAMFVGHKLILTTRPTVAGRIRLSAYLGKRRLGTCVTETPAGRSFTCRLTLSSKISLHARISVLASMRVGNLIVKDLLKAEQLPQMKMKPAGASARTAFSSAPGTFWCSPSTLVETLEGGSE